MTYVVADRVQDTSSTTGTGAMALDNAPPMGCRSFGSVCSTSDTCPYTISHRSANEWETGLGTYSATNQLTRTTVQASSNGGSAVNFSAGVKDVALTHNAADINTIDGGSF